MNREVDMIDTHIHIERGPYTQQWIQRFIDQALKMDIKEIYLLEHSHRFFEFEPLYRTACEYSNYQKEWYNRKKQLSIRQYETLITDMRKQSFPIKVKWGLEVCYFPENEQLIANLTRNFDFDFVIGSIHWIDGFGFDHRPELWEGLDVDNLYKRYYELMIQLVSSNLFSGLAHPDSIKCFEYFPSYDLSNIYLCLAKELVAHNMYAEQSGGLALNYNFPETGINQKMLSIFIQNGVELRTASDAHRPEDVGTNIIQLSQILTNQGYKHISCR